MITSKVVWASAAGAAAPPAGAPPAAIATGAAAVTPQDSSNFFTSSAASTTVSLLNESTIAAKSAMFPFSFVAIPGQGGFQLTAREPTIYFVLFISPAVG